MAIPKLLEKMRHSVQDTGDDNMTGNYVLEGGVLQSSNSDVDMLSNYIAIADSLVEADESNLLRLYYDVNGTPYMQEITHQYVPQKGLQINMDSEASGNTAIITGVADPIEAQDVATKNYVDNSGGTFYAIYGTTTYQEIVDAFNAGKTCKALYSSENSYPYIFDLVTRPTSSNPTLYFVSNRGDYSSSVTAGYTYLYINSSSSWSISSGTQYYISTPIYRGGFSTALSSSTAYYRPILVSTAAPTASEGYVGDIWIQYSM